MAYGIKEVRELVDKLNHYRDAYYNHNKSEISDRAYDEMFDRLKKMEETYGVVYADSPTQSVGYQVVSNLKKIKHSHLMLSLDKTTDPKKFCEYFFKYPKKGVMLMAKMDGLSVSLTYDHGKLIGAETRGDGETGEDILHTALAFANIPKQIPFTHKFVVDGECIIDEETFKIINEKEHTEYKHPRNLVSGTVRQLDASVCARRNVKFVAWRVIKGASSQTTIPNDVTDLNCCGFDIVPYEFIYNSDEFEEAKEKILAKCKELHYPIDGLVGTFMDKYFGESLGVTSHHPRHSLAFKFYQEENRTTLRDVEWNTTRSGRINPTAVFDPIEIDGTTVSRASLFNISIIEELQLGIGDEISVIKANQIIPHIVDNYTRSGPMSIPQYCPDCFAEAKIEDDNGRKVLVCPNENCPSKKIDALCHFASRDGLNIEGLSEASIELLYNVGYLTDFASFFKLPRIEEDIAKLEGFGLTSAHNLVEAINKAKNCTLASVISALGIPGVGKSTAKDIANYFSRTANLSVLTTYANRDFHWGTFINGIGEKTENNINEYIKANEHMLQELAFVLNVSNDKGTAGLALHGKHFGITGSLHIFPNRDALVADIEAHGGHFFSSITRETDYLITNEGASSSSSKTKKAIALGVTMITEEEYQALKG